MKNFIKGWMEKKGSGRWFQRDNLIILVLSGVLLFIIALPVKDGSTGEEAGWEKGQSRVQSDSLTGKGSARETGEENGRTAAQTEYLSGNLSDIFSGEDYCAYLERKLTETLCGMDGVGKVKVMITLNSTEELVVEKDIPVTRSSTNEQDAQGGSRIANQSDTAETTVYSTREGNSEPYVIKTLLPEIEGVVVVAQGAGNGSVNKNITELVQALFDVEAHKIKVVKMEVSGT